MVSISDVTLQIFEGPPTLPLGKARYIVSYTITATNFDGERMQDYHEVVWLIGDERGEGGTTQRLRRIVNGVVTFSTSQVGFVRSWENIIDSKILHTDPGRVIRDVEIRAVVTLTPIPSIPATKESNLVTLGGPVNQ